MGILDREKNRDNAMQQIKSMIKSEPQTESKTELKKNIVKYTPENKKFNDKIIVIPKKDEARSKRVNLLIQPSVHEKAQKKCKKLGVSLNECINQLVADWIKE